MSTPRVKMDVIDADANVVETERVWDYLEASDEKYRPTLTASPENPRRQIWPLDGENLGNKFPSPDDKQSAEHLKRFGRAVGTPVEARELSDVRQRPSNKQRLLARVQHLRVDSDRRRFSVYNFLRRRGEPRHRHRLRPRRYLERA